MHRADQTGWPELLETRLWEWPAEALADWESAVRAATGDRPAPVRDALSWLSDETLALAVQKGFLLHATFEELFVSRYLPAIMRWLYHWRTDCHEAEELVQQLFLKFYENRLHNFHAERSFRAYLRQALWNLWVERYRGRRTFPLPETSDIPAPEERPEQAALRLELERDIQDALERLEPEERLVLSETMSGRTADEIAARTKQPKQRVFRLLFNARRHMERLLARAGHTTLARDRPPPAP